MNIRRLIKLMMIACLEISQIVKANSSLIPSTLIRANLVFFFVPMDARAPQNCGMKKLLVHKIESTLCH